MTIYKFKLKIYPYMPFKLKHPKEKWHSMLTKDLNIYFKQFDWCRVNIVPSNDYHVNVYIKDILVRDVDTFVIRHMQDFVLNYKSCVVEYTQNKCIKRFRYNDGYIIHDTIGDYAENWNTLI